MIKPRGTKIAPVPRARKFFDDRGRLNVEASVRSGGTRQRRRWIIPGNDEETAVALLKELNLRLAMGEYDRVFRRKSERRDARTSTGPTLGSWIPEWLELYRPPNVGQRTFGFRTDHNGHGLRVGERGRQLA